MDTLLFGSQMTLVTFIFCIIETVLILLEFIFYFELPAKLQSRNSIILLLLLLFYNITSGLFPDPQIVVPMKVQEIIAYFGGFITPAFFPYYVYKSFHLKKIKYHVKVGIYSFLILPFFLFSVTYIFSGDLNLAKNLLVIPALYSLFFIYSLYKAIQYKFRADDRQSQKTRESIILYISITPWIGVAIIDYFNLGQSAEAIVSNAGFILLICYNILNYIDTVKSGFSNLMKAQIRIKDLNTNLEWKIKQKTQELELANEKQLTTFANLSHEMKTPLTILVNYLEDYSSKVAPSFELDMIRKSVYKIKNDIINYFDSFNTHKNIELHYTSSDVNLSQLLNEKLFLFTTYFSIKKIRLTQSVEERIYLKANETAIDRLLNNLLENAFKYSNENGVVNVFLYKPINNENIVILKIEDNGIGIPADLKKTVFKVFYQIQSNDKKNYQGMGLGLPIVKNIINSLNGAISINDSINFETGTCIEIKLPLY